MLQTWMQQSFWAFLLEAAVVVAVVSKIGAMLHYRRLMEESEQLERVRTKWMQALKKRFDNYGQLKFKVDRPEDFVDKYIELDRICGMNSRTFCHIPKVCAILIAIAACQGREIWIFSTGINLCGALLILELLINPYAKVRQVRTNLLLAIEKRMTKLRKEEKTKAAVPERRKKVPRAEEAAVSREPRNESQEILSKEEIESFGQILKEWWEF